MTIQDFLSTPDPQRDYQAAADLLFQLTHNPILHRHLSVNPRGKADFIIAKLKQYLPQETQEPDAPEQPDLEAQLKERTQFKSEDNEAKSFKAGKRADHDLLPDDIKALYVENLDLLHQMRELHLQLRHLSTPPHTDDERKPILTEFINLDKKLHDNWNVYDHYVTKQETQETVPSVENVENVPKQKTRKKCKT